MLLGKLLFHNKREESSTELPTISLQKREVLEITKEISDLFGSML